jgi:signal transduction histidine kinase/ActR/RegA family two-component response regulator
MKIRDYRKLFLNAPEPLMLVEVGSLTIRDANQRALSLVGYSEEELKELKLGAMLSPADCVRFLSATEPDADSAGIVDCTLSRKDGAPLPVDISTCMAGFDDLVLVALHDALEKSKMREQLRQAQKMEAVGMLAGGIAHDFNNLLTIISGYTQMLLVSPHVTTERDRTALEQVLRASERAADLTSQLLAFSRRQTIQPRVIEINRVVDQTVSMLRRLIGEDIELRIDKAADAGRIHADAAQIQQVLLNLVINARDAMPAGGTLIIRTHNADFAPGPNPRQHAKRGGYVVLEIADTGTGMDSATRQRIFEPFFTTKPEGKGTGLGLSTVYAIVKQAKGLIDFNTVVSEGTTFRVYLPRVRNELVEEPAANLEPAGGHETVLLVEDEEGVRRAVHSALERRGYHVLVAASGPEALDLSRSHQGPIDLLISDVVMPQMNGRELAKTLTGERPHIAVMFISGYPGDTLQSKGALAAEAVFLPKPFTPAALTTMVRQILDRRGKGRESTHNHGV